jgi:hypothetical protein
VLERRREDRPALFAAGACAAAPAEQALGAIGAMAITTGVAVALAQCRGTPAPRSPGR